LRAHVKRLVIVEFDIPDLPRGSDAYVASLAQRYERALGEYEGATRDPRPARRADGRDELGAPGRGVARPARTPGWRVTRLAHISDYFWAPAFALVADA
jgi:hypothetical protein